jgi:precorrin-2 dehydrogenase
MTPLFPMFLKLAGHRCLVVGAGHVAEQKIDSMLAAGAHVRVVAPEACGRIRELAESEKLTWTRRLFHPSDLDDMFLVIAATGNRSVNEEVFRGATAKQVLCNAVDEPDHCHFYYPAVVRRGDLQIAISTAGHSPALAQRLRSDLEVLIGPEYENLLQWLGRVRAMLFCRNLDPTLRRKTLRRIASREVSERFLRARQHSLRNKV